MIQTKNLVEIQISFELFFHVSQVIWGSVCVCVCLVSCESGVIVDNHSV